MEVAIAIDTSKQLTQDSLTKILNFLKASLKSFETNNTDTDDVTINILSYGNTVKLLPKSVNIKGALRQLERNFPEVGGEKDISAVLDFMNNNVFVQRRSRLDAKRLLLLTVFGAADTNGVSSQTLNELKRNDVEILILGIDTPISPLYVITQPSNIVVVDADDKLPSVIGPLEDKVGNIIGRTKRNIIVFMSCLTV